MGAAICPECCGTKKQKEIDCAVDCFYLGKSREYFLDRQEAARISDFDREMKSIMGKEDDHAGLLQNIEFIIHKIYKDFGTITDRHAATALEYLLEMGKAQLDLPAKFLTRLPENTQSIVDGVNDILRFRDSLSHREDLITRLKCIYRVLDSVRTHYDPKDDCSYLKFIGQFLR